MNSFLIVLQLFKHLNKDLKRQFIFLGFFIILSAGAEVFSLSALLPFINVLINTDNSITSLNIYSLAFVFLFAVIIAALLRVFTLSYNFKISAKIGTFLGNKCYRNVISQEYIYHLKNPSSTIVALFSVELGRTYQVLATVLQSIASFLIAIAIIFTLFFYTGIHTIYAFLIFGCSYLVIGKIIQKDLNKISKLIEQDNTNHINEVQESLGFIRDIILENKNNFYFESYNKIDKRMRNNWAKSIFLSSIPRPLIEAFAIITLVFISLFLTNNIYNRQLLISEIGLFIVASQRLLPILQQIYSGWSSINRYKAEIIKVLDILNLSCPEDLNDLKKINGDIHLEDITFSYDKNIIIQKFNLTIKKNEMVAIIGKSGSGKSTIIDIISGFLEPDKGKLIIDNIEITQNTYKTKRSWQNSISYVSQDIYLRDSNIIDFVLGQNIKNKKNIEKVLKLLKELGLENLINTKNKLNRKLGKGGGSLSGGQRQRLAIVKSFFSGRPVLIFDEATSSIDKKNETKVLDALLKLKGKKTIIFVTHNSEMVKFCDRTIQL